MRNCMFEEGPHELQHSIGSHATLHQQQQQQQRTLPALPSSVRGFTAVTSQ
jgi:hypothetical protein